MCLMSLNCTVKTQLEWLGVVVHPQRAAQTDLCGFEASLVFIASSRTARATWKDPVSKSVKLGWGGGSTGKGPCYLD